MERWELGEEQDPPSPQLGPGDDNRRLSKDRVMRAGMEGLGVWMRGTYLPLGGSRRHSLSWKQQ